MQTLSADNFYPDCPQCGADGGLSVVRNKQTSDWRCVGCGTPFMTTHLSDSKWAGVDDLPRLRRLVYIACEIRGMSPRQYARAGSINAEAVMDLLPHDSKWRGVDSLSAPRRAAYIACEIRGMSAGAYARVSDHDGDTVGDLVLQARYRLSHAGVAATTAVDEAPAD